jgi:hypothetical protein
MPVAAGPLFELFARAFERVVDHLGTEYRRRQRLLAGVARASGVGQRRVMLRAYAPCGLGPHLVGPSDVVRSRASPAGRGEEPAGLRCRLFPGRGKGMLRGGNTLENLEHVSFGEFLEAGQRSGELEKGSKVLTVTFVAHRQPAIAAQPSQGAFDLPPVTAEAFAAVDAAAGDPRNDAPGPQPPAVHGIVVTLVRPQPAGSAAPRTAR